MIRGYTREALVVYPSYEDYVGRSRNYEIHIDKAASKVKEYLEKCGIRYQCFATDDVANLCEVVPDDWVLTLGSGDMFFAKTNCKGMDRDFSRAVKHPEIYKECLEKYPPARGQSLDGRFETMLLRDAKAKREIVKKYSLVILFNQPKSPAIKLTPKKDSGKLYILIDNTNFLAKCYISDMEVNPIDILGIPNGNAPVYEWEVENAE